MCIICKEYKARKLSLKEALINWKEIKKTIDEEHQKEVDQMLWDELWNDYYHLHGNAD